MKFTPRLRMFAGPNGSGKSTLKSVFSANILGVYINPDEIEKEIHQFGSVDLSAYPIDCNEHEILDFFQSSTLLHKANLLDDASRLTFSDGKLGFLSVKPNSYFASVVSDYIRKKLLQLKVSFSFETVMSFKDKIELLKLAQQQGFETYLYYVATEDPAINISRVKYRHIKGGHDVPEDKIESRYYRSLGLLHEALAYSNHAYFFDNSGTGATWLAEMDEQKQLKLKTDNMPFWFTRHVISYLNTNG